MSFKNQHHRYKRRIDKHWAPVSIEVMLQEGPEKKISILKKAQQQAAKEILHLEVASAFMEKLESEIKIYQDELNNNDPSSTSQSSQSNETLNTGESKGQITGEPVEKIDWEAGITELAFMFEILFKNADIGCSMKQYKRRWNLIAKHFTINGKEITSKGIRGAFHELKKNKTTNGKPLKHELYESLLELTTEIKGTKT
mgnify:CR=1 FL=1